MTVNRSFHFEKKKYILRQYVPLIVHIQILLTGYVGLILCSTTVATTTARKSGEFGKRLAGKLWYLKGNLEFGGKLCLFCTQRHINYV